MYVKIKSYRLKKEVAVEELEKYGFEKNSSDNWTRTINGVDYVIYYADTKRFVLRIFLAREGRAKKVGKYIQDLICCDLVEKVNFYYWLCIFGSYKNYSDEKTAKIEKRLEELNNHYENS